jgi:hypothetical protein
MGKYAMSWFNHVTSTSPTTAGFLAMNTGQVCEVVEFVMTGSAGAGAADTMHTAFLAFFDVTTTGTATSYTPQPLDNLSQAFPMLTAATHCTAEPTAFDSDTVENVVQFGFNQRGGMRWAVPLGEGVVVRGDDTDDDGIAARVDSQVAGAVDGMIHMHAP